MDNTSNKKANKHLPYYYEENDLDTYFAQNKIIIPETEQVRNDFVKKIKMFKNFFRLVSVFANYGSSLALVSLCPLPIWIQAILKVIYNRALWAIIDYYG